MIEDNQTEHCFGEEDLEKFLTGDRQSNNS